MSKTKRGNRFQDNVISRRKGSRGLRAQFEDRRVKRLNDLKKLSNLMRKKAKEDLCAKELVLLENLSKMTSYEEFEKKTTIYRTRCLRFSHDRLAGLKYCTQSKVVSHPSDSTFTKRVKYISERGRERLLRLKRLRDQRKEKVA
jgi:hypothetical protein